MINVNDRHVQDGNTVDILMVLSSYLIKISSKTKVGRISVLKGGNKLSY